jgi:hypothetical protein
MEKRRDEMDVDRTVFPLFQEPQDVTSQASHSSPVHQTSLEEEQEGGGGGGGSIDRVCEIPQVVLDRANALKYRLSHFYTNLLAESIDREKR